MLGDALLVFVPALLDLPLLLAFGNLVLVVQLVPITVARLMPDGSIAAEFTIASATHAGVHVGFAERMDAAIPVTSNSNHV